MPATDFSKLSKELSGSTGMFGSLLLFVVIALVAILLFWASVTELDNVTRGQGKIVSSIQNQIVQASEEGVIKARFVEEGQKVKKGDIIGFVGSTGRSQAPHLHYEVHKDKKRVNPINFYLGNLTPDEFDDLLKLANQENQSLD